MKRYKMGYVTDEWGMNRHLGLIEDPNGPIIKYSDFEAYKNAGMKSRTKIECKPVSEEELAETEKRLEQKKGWDIFGDNR